MSWLRVLMAILIPSVAFSLSQRTFQKEPDECFYFMGVERQGNQQKLKFLSNCDENRYIIVCIEQNFRSYRTVKSFQRVQPGGVFSVFTLPGYRAKDAVWYSSTDSELESPCTQFVD